MAYSRSQMSSAVREGSTISASVVAIFLPAISIINTSVLDLSGTPLDCLFTRGANEASQILRSNRRLGRILIPMAVTVHGDGERLSPRQGIFESWLTKEIVGPRKAEPKADG